MGRDRTQEHVSAPTNGGIPSALVHELRTPLTAIHGYAQLLDRRADDPAAVHRAADIMLRESSRLAAMLGELSQVAELDHGPIVCAPIDVDVVAVVREAVGRVVGESRRHEVVIVGERELREQSDPRRLLQILTHLLANAIRFSPKGGCITVGVKALPSAVRVSIGDDGIGIPNDEAERVYERYFRGAVARRLGIRGLGLGLYIASEIATCCAGRIWHEPAAGGGTVFHLELRRAQAMDETPATVEAVRS
jgi:signal transduction histidine kinase